MKQRRPRLGSAEGMARGIRAPARLAAVSQGQLSRPRPRPPFPEPESPLGEVYLDRFFRELVRYYRHSCVGRLCRGIVHRIGTPLQVLVFLLDLLERQSRQELEVLAGVASPPGETLRTLHRYREHKTRQFRQELETLQELVNSLVLQGAHEEAEDRRFLDLNEIYRRELDLYLAHSSFKQRLEKVCSFQEGLPPIYGHYIDFSQSFRNLLENALEAMEGADRRRLTVATSLEPGRRLLQIGDTGSGIPREIRPRIFEPFFTTKGTWPGERAGLGLFMARRLLAPYGGEILINSIPGETWVIVALPVRQGQGAGP